MHPTEKMDLSSSIKGRLVTPGKGRIHDLRIDILSRLWISPKRLTLPSEGRRITLVVFLSVLQVITRLQLIGECHDGPLTPRIQETTIDGTPVPRMSGGSENLGSML